MAETPPTGPREPEVESAAEPDSEGPLEAGPEALLADHPGKPRSRDALDPELVRLSKPRTRVDWLLSASVIVFCVYWMISLRSDLAFSRQSGSAEAVELATVGDHDNQYVEVTLVPDRARIARVWRGADFGSHVAPALGSAGRAWLLTDSSAYVGDVELGESHAGRVRRLGDMPFYSQLRDYFASAPPVLEPLAVDSVAELIRSRATSAESVHGDRIDITAETAVEVGQRVRGRVRVVVIADPGGLASEAGWRSALVRAGVVSASTAPVASTDTSWTYEIEAPAGIEQVQQTLDQSDLPGARAVPIEKVYRATWGQLGLEAGELIVAGDPLSAGEMTFFSIAHRPTVVADAAVIVSTERPDDYWYMLPLYVLFAAFALIFGWVLFRTFRADDSATT